MKEIFKDIPGYEDYKVSDKGNVKSFKRCKEGKIKTARLRNRYLSVQLCKNDKRKDFQVHQLVMMAFRNHKPNGMKTVINHINEDKFDNRLENLELCSVRYNTVYSKDKSKTTSEYIGVSWNKVAKKWLARIYINGKSKHLGYFDNEYEAHLAYQKALKELKKPLNY